MRSRILVGLLAGMIGGFLGWLLQEHSIDYNAHVMSSAIPGLGVVTTPLKLDEVRILVLGVGGLIGLFLGAVDGIVESSTRKLWQGMLIGAFAGFVLGFVGIFFGSEVYNRLGGSDQISRDVGIFAFGRQVIARSFGWALMGLGMGAGSAIATRNPKRIGHGAIGGFLGGFVGGFIFDLLATGANPVQQAIGASSSVRDGGGPSRAVGFTAIGGLSGLFIGIVEELLKQAWVKVLAGKNEGKDYILTKPVSILGRDERCDVPLFGDMSVGVQHAAIRAEKSRHTLIDANTPAGTIVNGQRVPPGGELLLRDGDMIQIGTHRILFREKATASKVGRPAVDVPKPKAGSPASSVPMPSHLCPFCGGMKDAAGNCNCSIAGGVGASPAAGYGNNSGMSSASGYSPGASGTQFGGYGASASYGGAGAAPGGGLDMPRLVGIEGPYAGEVFFLTGQSISLGREPGNHIVLAADTTISRNHARISNEGGDLVVYDVGSSNGTFVNGMRVTMQVLVPGDIVQIGQTSKFRYE